MVHVTLLTAASVVTMASSATLSPRHTVSVAHEGDATASTRMESARRTTVAPAPRQPSGVTTVAVRTIESMLDGSVMRGVKDVASSTSVDGSQRIVDPSD